MREKILDILSKVCDDDIVKNDTGINLYDTMLMDSLVLIEFIYAIEDEFGVEIQPTEVSREDMDTPDKIVSLVEGLCKSRS